MTWLKLDDGFPEHEKVVGLSDRAFRLHVSALCYCARTLSDGHVSDRGLKVVSASLGWSSTKRLVSELVRSGLWSATDVGHSIKDFTDYNPTAEEVREQRKRNSERQKRFREAKRNALRNGAPVPSRPVPVVPEVVSPPQDAARREGAKTDPGTIGRLVAACGGGPQVRTKIGRTITAHRLCEADIAWALESATGPNVREPLAVALAELKKRGDARRSAA